MKSGYESPRAAIVFAGLLFVMAVSPSIAQGTSSISGTVVDTSQAIVVGSQVTLTNVGTGQPRVIASSRYGFFEFPDLSPGNYKVTVNKNGFKAWEQSSITLSVAQHIKRNGF